MVWKMLKDIKKKIAKNTVISFSGKIISSLLGLVSVAFIARELGPEGFGNYNIVVAFLYVFSVFADFGLYNYLTREVSIKGADEKKIVSNVFISRVILLLFFYTLSFVVVYFIPSYSYEIKIGILLASLGFVFLSLSQVLMGIFQKYLKTILPAVADITARAIQLALVLYLYMKGANFLDFLIVFILGAFINFVLVYYFARKIIPFKIQYKKEESINILKQSWPLAVSSVLVLIYFKGDTIIMSFLKDSADVGVYNLSYKIIENIIFFPAMFVGLVMPLLSRYFKLSMGDFKKVFQKSFDFLNVISIPLVFGGFYLSSGIINIIGGSEFTDSVAPLRILIFSIFFIFLGALFGNAIIAIRKQKQVMWAYGTAAVFNISANIYFIGKYSYIGAAFVNVATEFIATIFMFIVIYKTIRYVPRINVLLKALLASFAMVFILYIFPFQNFFILLLVGTATYFIFMYLIKGISREDFTLFFKK